MTATQVTVDKNNLFKASSFSRTAARFGVSDMAEESGPEISHV